MPEAHTYPRGNAAGAAAVPVTGGSGTSSAPPEGPGTFRETVCLNGGRVYDSCSSKDCLEDLRVYLTEVGEEIINASGSVKTRSADVLYVSMDVDSMPFNPGYYSVDMTFYFLVTLDAYAGHPGPAGRGAGPEHHGHCNPPMTVQGIAVSQKTVILYGSEGSVRSFRSDDGKPGCLQDDTPIAQVQTVEPISLSLRMTETAKPDTDTVYIPPEIAQILGGCINTGEAERYVYTTIGLFSIVSLERNIQMMMPVYDFCIPEKECVSAAADDPCQLFQQIRFPVGEFFPPKQEE